MGEWVVVSLLLDGHSTAKGGDKKGHFKLDWKQRFLLDVMEVRVRCIRYAEGSIITGKGGVAITNVEAGIEQGEEYNSMMFF